MLRIMMLLSFVLMEITNAKHAARTLLGDGNTYNVFVHAPDGSTMVMDVPSTATVQGLQSTIAAEKGLLAIAHRITVRVQGQEVSGLEQELSDLGVVSEIVVQYEVRPDLSDLDIMGPRQRNDVSESELSQIKEALVREMSEYVGSKAVAKVRFSGGSRKWFMVKKDESENYTCVRGSWSREILPISPGQGDDGPDYSAWWKLLASRCPGRSKVIDAGGVV